MLSSLKLKLYLSLTFLLGFIAATTISFVYSHGGDTNLIHGCIDNKGNLRVVGANENCKNKETALDWNIQGPPGPPGNSNGLPFICITCNLYPYGDKFKGQDFSDAQIPGSVFSGPNGVGGSDLEGVIFSGGILNSVSFARSNLTNANLSNLLNTETAGGDSIGFLDANLTNTNLSNGDFPLANFDGAIVNGTDFTDSDLSGAHFIGATLSNVIWNNTICPDGTNSNNNGNTCEEHLNP